MVGGVNIDCVIAALDGSLRDGATMIPKSHVTHEDFNVVLHYWDLPRIIDAYPVVRHVTLPVHL